MSLLVHFFQNLIEKFSLKNKQVIIETQTLLLLQLMNNKKLMTKMMKLTDYMRDRGHSAYVVFVNDLMGKNFSSLKEAHHTYLKINDHSRMLHPKKETEETKLLAKLSKLLEKNSNEKHDKSQDYLQEITAITVQLEELRNKRKQEQNQR